MPARREIKHAHSIGLVQIIALIFDLLNTGTALISHLLIPLWITKLLILDLAISILRFDCLLTSIRCVQDRTHTGLILQQSMLTKLPGFDTC